MAGLAGRRGSERELTVLFFPPCFATRVSLLRDTSSSVSETSLRCSRYVFGSLPTNGRATNPCCSKSVWPQCWKRHEVCSVLWVDAVTYLEICGIIIGQILVGIEGDWIGRRFGLIQGERHRSPCPGRVSS